MEHQTPPVPAPAPMIPPKRNYWKLTAGLLILACICLVGVILFQQKTYSEQITYLTTRQNQVPFETPEVNTEAPQVTNQPETGIPPIMEFTRKKFLSSDMFFDKTPYPSELTTLNDNNLIGFTCEDKYFKQQDGSFSKTNPRNNLTNSITDNAILSYLSSKEQETKKISERSSLLSATICLTETGKTLLGYEITPGGGGAGSSSYYGYFDGTNTAVAEIPIENFAYFTCNEVLAITKENTLYIKCGAGDGGAGSVSLYKVGLYKAYGADLLLKCTSVSSGEDGAQPKVSCGTSQ